MEKRKLDNWEIENIEDSIQSIEEMFQIKFHSEELINVSDFNELCDVIIEEITLEDVDSCTKQQAFYKVRNVFDKVGIKEKSTFTLDNSLSELLPRSSRKRLVKQICDTLGFDINLLFPPRVLYQSLIYGILISFVLLFIKLQIGLIGIVVLIPSMIILSKQGIELNASTIKELVELITRENYLKARSENGTVNRKELKTVITDWLSDTLEMNKEELINARFI
ncbi:hypothetical protein L3073_04670 [Ancylomarina sp. DW003]|nr:hypothetical protein [Ancylomarina sp. DW003]MDE5421489.1 hypothetical protein [Ancylomarina sp. DW003]